MKKKLLSILICIFLTCFIAFVLTACSKNEPPHTHVYEQKVVNDAFKDSDATCVDKATYYYSCTCGEKGLNTFKSGEALGHSFVNYVSDNNATSAQDGTKTAVCEREGCNETNTVIDEGSKLNESVDLKYELNSDGLGYTVTGIGTCNNTNLVIPSTYENKPVTSIGNFAFYDCYSLTSIEIPNSVTSIGYAAFSNCYSLTSIEIPDSVTSIGKSAFFGCDSLTSIEIPDSVTSIGSYAFVYCNSLTSVYYTGTIDEWVQIEFDNYDSNPLYRTINLYINNQLVTEANIITATKINAYAFYNCNSLTSVVIGDSVTSIGYDAFSGCDSLTSITIPDSVTSIGSPAFNWCYRLVEVVNKSTCITVEKGSSGNGYLGYYALSVSNCDDSYVSRVSTDSNGYVIYNDGVDRILVSYVGTQTSLTLPNNITKINNYTFYNCDSLTSVEIPDSVTSIGSYAFAYCDSLTSITIPDSVTSIGSSAFSNCYSLTSIEIPDSVTSIGERAFYWCDSLTSITIPNSVTSIGDYAFYWCDSLTSIEIPDSVTSIGNYAFANCSALIYNIKDGLKYLGNSTNNYLYLADTENTSIITAEIDSNCRFIGSYAFSDCNSLTSVVIGDSVTSIGYDAFYNCDSLTSVVIGDSVTSIGRFAFYDCDSLTSVTFEDSTTWYRIYWVDNNAYENWQNKTGGTQVDVTNPSTNANYIDNDYYWYKI